MFGYKNPWIDSSTSWEQEELNNKITKDNYYKRSKVTDKDTGKAKYHALNEILDPETGKYELSDYYGDVTPEGSHMMEPVYAEYQQGGQVKDKFGFGKPIKATKDTPVDDYIRESIEEFGEGDIGYVIGALRYTKDFEIINPNMNASEAKKAMKKHNLMAPGFERSIDKETLNWLWSK